MTEAQHYARVLRMNLARRKLDAAMGEIEKDGLTWDEAKTILVEMLSSRIATDLELSKAPKRKK